MTSFYSTCAQVRPSRMACIAPFVTPRLSATSLELTPFAIIKRARRTASSVNLDFPFRSPRTKCTRPSACWNRVFALRVQYRRFDSRLSSLSPLMWSMVRSDWPRKAKATRRWTRHWTPTLFCQSPTIRYPSNRTCEAILSGRLTKPTPFFTREAWRITRPWSLTEYRASNPGTDSHISSMSKIVTGASTPRNGLSFTRAFNVLVAEMLRREAAK